MPADNTTIDQVQAKLDLIFRLLTSNVRGWSLDEAQEILGLSRSTLYREIAEKKIKTTYRRGRPFITHAEVVRYHGSDPLAELVPFLREVMNHLRCPMQQHPACPMKNALKQFETENAA